MKNHVCAWSMVLTALICLAALSTGKIQAQTAVTAQLQEQGAASGFFEVRFPFKEPGSAHDLLDSLIVYRAGDNISPTTILFASDANEARPLSLASCNTIRVVFILNGVLVEDCDWPTNSSTAESFPDQQLGATGLRYFLKTPAALTPLLRGDSVGVVRANTDNDVYLVANRTFSESWDILHLARDGFAVDLGLVRHNLLALPLPLKVSSYEESGTKFLTQADAVVSKRYSELTWQSARPGGGLASKSSPFLFHAVQSRDCLMGVEKCWRIPESARGASVSFLTSLLTERSEVFRHLKHAERRTTSRAVVPGSEAGGTFFTIEVLASLSRTV